MIVAVADGELIPMNEIPDPVFAGGSMGECLGIIPENGKIYALVSGTILDIAQTGHAVTITSDDGRNLMIHAGINTVSLGKRAYKHFVKPGDHVDADQLIMEMDLNMIRKAGASTMIIVIELRPE